MPPWARAPKGSGPGPWDHCSWGRGSPPVSRHCTVTFSPGFTTSVSFTDSFRAGGAKRTRRWGLRGVGGRAECGDIGARKTMGLGKDGEEKERGEGREQAEGSRGALVVMCLEFCMGWGTVSWVGSQLRWARVWAGKCLYPWCW